MKNSIKRHKGPLQTSGRQDDDLVVFGLKPLINKVVSLMALSFHWVLVCTWVPLQAGIHINHITHITFRQFRLTIEWFLWPSFNKFLVLAGLLLAANPYQSFLFKASSSNSRRSLFQFLFDTLWYGENEIDILKKMCIFIQMSWRFISEDSLTWP